ncbi:MAG: cell division protein ZipA C-terminal FtsZ-binding domain-containing protein [Capsulimonadales bacterium]|nr:cell division protein ZipA C-terminal FtsZ-binding domain-containing protein [Capsulimonadales bacterium]
MGDREYHRFGSEELYRTQEIRYAPDTVRRIALALGPTPPDDARHLLAPVSLPPPFPPLPDGPLPATEFVVELVGRYPISAAALSQAFPPGGTGLGFGRLRIQRERSQGRWSPFDRERIDGRIEGIAFSWELASLLTEGTEAVRELAGYLLRTEEIAGRLFLQTAPSDTPEEAAVRAARLAEIKRRFARSVEMRLLPQGRSFPTRAVWRHAYALGLRWGDLDLFHWHDPVADLRLFSLNALGHPGYFLPERAAEGEGTAGIALSFELPRCPAPIETYDRMGVALAYLRQHLGGRPQTGDGRELDADRLYDDRDALDDAVREMNRFGIAPGSPTAVRFF